MLHQENLELRSSRSRKRATAQARAARDECKGTGWDQKRSDNGKSRSRCSGPQRGHIFASSGTRCSYERVHTPRLLVTA